MATTAAARRSEPSSSKSTENQPLRSPARAQPMASRASTPSISPLSTASRPAVDASESMPDVAMEDPAVQVDVENPNGFDGAVENALGDQDDCSSSLSEPEYESEDDLRHNGDDRGAAQSVEDIGLRVAEEDDSEAETERLEPTPHKLQKHTDSLGRTPSKLSHAATVEDELSEPPSPLQELGVGAASSTSTIATSGAAADGAIRKRKRSSTASSPLTSDDELPRKRSNSSIEAVGSNERANGADVDRNAHAHEEDDMMVEETPMPVSSLATQASSPAKGIKGKKGKQKSRRQKGVLEDIEPEPVEEVVEPEDEQSEEHTAKTEEEIQAKAVASNLFEDLAKQFTAFRDKLYSERLNSLTAELELLSQPSCTHPEYVRQMACVDAKREKQIKEADFYYKHKFKSIRDRTLGERASLHSQYFQLTRETREDTLYALGEDWYKIQKERRQSHTADDDRYVFKYPSDRRQLIKQQAKYNLEVSILSGFAKHVGFPAAPEMTGASDAALDDDLKGMKITRRQHQHVPHTHTPWPPKQMVHTFQPNERTAHEQFMEQNAWARPQPPIHQHTIALTHTPDWNEAPQHQSKSLMRNLSGQLHRTSSPFMTPGPQKRLSDIHPHSSSTVAMQSDGAEPPSSVLAAPPTTDRIHLLQNRNGDSPLHMLKQRQNNGEPRELTGYRNISNISGASTIEMPAEERMSKEGEHKVPILSTETSAPLSRFETSALHSQEHGLGLGEGVRKEVYANTGFRPQEGAFGTPAPMQTERT